MNVIPTGLALGAEIANIDLSKEVSAADRDFIVNAYTEHLVLLFRGLIRDERVPICARFALIAGGLYLAMPIDLEALYNGQAVSAGSHFFATSVFGLARVNPGGTLDAGFKGGKFFFKLPALPGVDAETKFKDPNGVVFDVAEHDWQTKE